MNGVGIGTTAAIIAAVRATIRQAQIAGRTVWYGAVAGTVVPTAAGLRIGAATRTAAATTLGSGSAGQVCNALCFLPFTLEYDSLKKSLSLACSPYDHFSAYIV